MHASLYLQSEVNGIIFYKRIIFLNQNNLEENKENFIFLLFNLFNNLLAKLTPMPPKQAQQALFKISAKSFLDKNEKKRKKFLLNQIEKNTTE